MSRNATSELLVCYDIRDERRLQRVHRCMCGWGMPLQYSVFYCRLAPRSRRRMENRLRELMDERADDIRIYGIQSLAETLFIGDKPMPDGIELHGIALLQSRSRG
jgi:CRISPR-associated protein Cas2